MILHAYVARQFLRALGIVTAIFVVILLPIDLAEQTGRVGLEHGFGAALELALLNLPGNLYDMIPLFVLLASLLLFVGLSHTSELVVIYASGRSALRVVAAPVVVAVLFGGLVIGVLNPVVAFMKQEYNNRTIQYLGGEERMVSVTYEGLWLRDGDTTEQTIIRANASNADGTHLFDVSFIHFAPLGSITSRINAAEAQLIDGAWSLRMVRRWLFAEMLNPEANVETFETLTLPSTLTRDQIRNSFAGPDKIPIYELPTLITQLKQAGFAALHHRVWFQMELSAPLFLAAMVLIGSCVAIRHTRSSKIGLMVLLFILMGFGFFFIRSFAQVLGENGQLAIAIVAWTPPVSAILLSVGLILRLEDG